MRISGLATGMDTESIIRDLMKANRIPLDKITQKKQYLEWQLDDYRSINRNLRSMSDNLFDTIMRQSTFMAKSVSVSNPEAVGIKALSATSEFAGTIEVSKLATQATLHGHSLANSDGKFIKNEKEVTAEEFTNSTLKELGLADGFTSITIEAPGMEKAVRLDFSEQDTIQAIITEINQKAGVNAFFDSGTGKIAMTSKNSGQGEIMVTGGYKDEETNTEYGDLNRILFGENPVSKEGVDAVFTFNGLETKRSSNTFQINGFEINLKQVTTETGPVTFSSAPDTDKILDSVVKFVDDYNKMIEELNSKIREPKYRDFQPLSDEQKKEMKEKEIELWEEKAKSGTLRNDSTISSMLQKLRNVLNGTVEGTNGEIRLADIGITTSTSYTENGKLVIDEDKLRTAIAEDPNKVYELFAKTSDTPEKAGLATQFRAVVDESRKAISDKAGKAGAVNDTFTLGRNLNDMNKQIERFEDRLKMMEDRYWKQFTAMERAIQRANAQSASLMNAFGGM